MEKILISACLAGERVRYDGKLAPLDHPVIRQLELQGRLVKFCPEMAGGLPLPRPPAEIISGSGDDVLKGGAPVKNIQGEDVSRAFISGAEQALALAVKEGVKAAILKQRSPSCGKSEIYDGTFSGTLIPGMGVTAALMRQQGILVFCEDDMAELDTYLNMP